jgi:hypothetical protein
MVADSIVLVTSTAAEVDFTLAGADSTAAAVSVAGISKFARISVTA